MQKREFLSYVLPYGAGVVVLGVFVYQQLRMWQLQEDCVDLFRRTEANTQRVDRQIKEHTSTLGDIALRAQQQPLGDEAMTENMTSKIVRDLEMYAFAFENRPVHPFLQKAELYQKRLEDTLARCGISADRVSGYVRCIVDGRVEGLDQTKVAAHVNDSSK